MSAFSTDQPIARRSRSDSRLSPRRFAQSRSSMCSPLKSKYLFRLKFAVCCFAVAHRQLPGLYPPFGSGNRSRE